MKKFKCIHTSALDLTGGQILAPGEIVSLSADGEKDGHNARLIEEGKLLEIKSTTSKTGGEK